jgi:hypothetical protein
VREPRPAEHATRKILARGRKRMSRQVTIEFKDPDFVDSLVDAGVDQKAAERIRAKAEGGESYSLRLTFSVDGTIVSASFVKAK